MGAGADLCILNACLQNTDFILQSRIPRSLLRGFHLK